MILEFKVKNYKSFKSEQVLSFEATSDISAEEYYCVRKPLDRVLKFAAIYGSNASGKSNLLDAVKFLRDIAITPQNDKTYRTGFMPFMLDADTPHQDGEFEITFYIGDLKYIYQVRLNRANITYEKLEYFGTSRKSMLFMREHVAEGGVKVKFGDKAKCIKEDDIQINKSTLPNMTVLSAFAKYNLNVPLIEDVYKYFVYGFNQSIDINTNLFYWANEIIKDAVISKASILGFLNRADFNISNFEIKEEEIDDNLKQLLLKFSKSVGKEDAADSFKKLEVNFNHRVIDNGQTHEFILDADSQSKGTKRYYGLAALLLKAIKEDSFILIDELEDSLHPDLYNHFITAFLLNTMGRDSQLLFTTHNVGLLDYEDIRKDVIWFTEKQETGATELYSLAEFKIRPTLSYSKAYKLGKFGAVPNLINSNGVQ